VTEAERYEKSVYRPGKGKKRNPQEEWMDLIERASQQAPVALQDNLQALAGLGNVPRKIKQFRNFTANSLNLRGKQVDAIDDAWNYLNDMRNKENDVRKKEQAKQKEQEDERKAKEQAEKATANESKDDDSDSDTTAESKEKTLPCSKTVRKTMKKILKKEQKSMKFKLLRSKVCDALGLDKSLQKKLKKMLQTEVDADDSKIKVDGKMVALI